MIIEAACVGNMGKVRGNNEDNFYFRGQWMEPEENGLEDILLLRESAEKPVCVAVFDGMGGEQRGEEASYFAAVTLSEMVKKEAQSKDEVTDWLNVFCKEANRRICQRMDETGVKRMGSTAAILYAYEDRLWMCNIGDSRVYGLCEGNLLQWSVDHTDAAFLQTSGIQKRKPCLTQHLGIRPQEMVIEPFVDSRLPRAEEKYLLCSDGLTDMVTTEEIEYILKKKTDVKNCAGELMELALARGGRDNITIIVCKISDV